jgi:hypothetical protein
MARAPAAHNGAGAANIDSIINRATKYARAILNERTIPLPNAVAPQIYGPVVSTW